MKRQLGPDYCGPGCRGLCPCPMWHNHKKVDNRSVDPQMRWQKPLKGYNVSSTKKMKHGFAYVGEYE